MDPGSRPPNPFGIEPPERPWYRRGRKAAAPKGPAFVAGIAGSIASGVITPALGLHSPIAALVFVGIAALPAAALEGRWRRREWNESAQLMPRLHDPPTIPGSVRNQAR
jgi:hypothetical protein